MNSFSGAVDLSSLGGTKQEPGTAGGSGAGKAQDGVIAARYRVDLTRETLREIAQRSTQLPIVVLFVAGDTGKDLAVKLEDLAAKNDGRFQLVVADGQAEPELAQAFGVSGVPAAVALIQAQPVPMFQGIPDQAQLESVVNQVVTAGAQYGLTAQVSGGGDQPVPSAPAYELAAREALGAGNLERAAQIYREEIAQNPGNDAAKAGLARVNLDRRAGQTNAAEAVSTADAAGPADVDAAIAAADAEVAAHLAPHAFDRLIATVAATHDDDRDRAREHLLELFEAVGATAPEVMAARRKLATVLF